jgi:hypothetical protein
MKERKTDGYKERNERQDVNRGGIKTGERTNLFIYLFIYSFIQSFNNAVRIPNYIASNG